MKKTLAISIFLAVFIMTMPAMAEEQTLFQGEVSYGGFGGPELKITSINGDLGLMTGGRGGFIINHVLSIGGGGYGLATDIEAPERDMFMAFGYGGGIIEVILASDKVVHVTGNLLIGGGGLSYREDWSDVNYNYDVAPSDNFFVLEPGLNLEVNVLKFFRIGAGVSYRYVNGIERTGLTDKDMSGVSINVSLKFGTF